MSSRNVVRALAVSATALALGCGAAACGGDDDGDVATFDDVEATRAGFLAAAEQAYVDNGDDPTDQSTFNKGLRLEDCFVLDDEALTSILDLADANLDPDDAQDQPGYLVGNPDSESIDCTYRVEQWGDNGPYRVGAGTTTLTKDQFEGRVTDDEGFDVVDDEIEGLDPETVVVVDAGSWRTYTLVEDDFFVRISVPEESVDDATAAEMLTTTVAEVERVLQG